MKKVIRHIRRQPEEVRRHVLHIVVMIAAVVLVLLWIYSLGVHLTDPDTRIRAQQDLAPFTDLKDSMAHEYQTISDSP